MTEKKKKPEAKKASTTQRYSDVAKELGLEVKALLALADQFVEAHPDFKDLVYAEGKKPAASSNFSKFYRDDFMKFAEDKLPKKEEPAPVPAPVVAPAAPAKPLVEAAKPVAPVIQTAPKANVPPTVLPPRPAPIAPPRPAAGPTPVVPPRVVVPTNAPRHQPFVRQPHPWSRVPSVVAVKSPQAARGQSRFARPSWSATLRSHSTSSPSRSSVA
jgi:hypothetical protein